jgi:hypothetical protein
LIHNLQLVEWVQRLAPAMPITKKVVDAVRWATLPVRRALRLRSLPGRPIAALRAHRLASRAAREAMRRRMAAQAAEAAARQRWSLLYPASQALGPLLRTAHGQTRFLSRQVEGGAKLFYRQLGWTGGGKGGAAVAAAGGKRAARATACA